MKPTGQRATAPRSYSRTGMTTLRRTLTASGKRLLSRRYKLGRALAQWRAELVADLGGEAAVSTQQAAVIELAMRTKLMLDSIDAWLLEQPTLVDKRSRRLLPAVQQRQSLADSLSRYLMMLGLERRRTLSFAQAIEEAPDLAPVDAQDDPEPVVDAQDVEVEDMSEAGPEPSAPPDDPPSVAEEST